ncbi:hypothetical protein LPJ53_006139 [Coemansia erecta]|uniref:DEK-C domain-containing protein n=1 Tax=Coemansia erecta TaxID=147472 RepID=A0A9W7XV55_9FUNG|nr:hypothetical protein LPJ53_006139 [Coemansia erecta]
MDDFSWGNMRIVVGDDGKRQIFVKDEEPFDPDEIQMRTWAEYEGKIFKRQQQIQEMEAVAQAIDEFGNAGVRPVSRFTQIPGLGPAQQQLQRQQQTMSLYSHDPQAFNMPQMQQVQQTYSPGMYSAYFGSMANVAPAAHNVATSSYNLVQVPQSSQMPSDDAIVSTISSILALTDLASVSIKQVRDELSHVFGIDMSPRREFINQTIQSMLQR